MFRFATRLDKLLNVLGLFFAVLAGAAFPLTTIVFGQLINLFSLWQSAPGKYVSAHDLVSQVSSNTLFFIYLAITVFVSTYIFMSCFVFTSERQTHQIRSAYLKAVLRQNMGWFDNQGAGEVTVRITSDTLLIQDGIGEKIPLAVNQFVTFVSGIVIALIKSWKLTLVLLSVIPLIIISASITNALNRRFQTRILDLCSTSGLSSTFLQ